jgi:cell division transport system permease protein
MTVAAIAIALALPASLFVALSNLERLGGGWHRGAAMTLFLQPGIDEQRGSELAAALQARNDIDAIEMISRDQGLAEFREYSGLGAALDQLSDNPLPVVLAVYPVGGARQAHPIASGASAESGEPISSSRLDALAAELEAVPDVDFIRIDVQWLQRFKAIILLLRNASVLLAGVLGLAVLLVVGNTIRLEIENRRGEVQIMDLVGATPAFIRRPFLYAGAWYGMLGGIVAWVMVALSVQALRAPVGRLATLYHTEFDLGGLALLPSLALLAVSTTLGILGSWVAVGRHLSRIEPD